MIRRWLPIVALLASSIAIMVAVVVYVRLDDQDGRINGNRVAQTRQSCRERNEERGVFRATFQTQRQQTLKIPAAVFEQFNVTRREAIGRLDKALAELQPLDCKARVRVVRDALG